MPALPLDDAGPYVAVMAIRQARLQKEIDELATLVEARLDRDEEKVGVL